jgi:hypothetical protein
MGGGDRDFDVVVFGATKFVGRLVASYSRVTHVAECDRPRRAFRGPAECGADALGCRRLDLASLSRSCG